MDKVELERRIEQTQEKLAKAIKAKETYYNQISEESKSYAELDLNTFQISKLPISHEDERALESFNDKKKLVKTLEDRLSKYQDNLKKLETFEKQDKIKVIWDFLLRWKEGVADYIRENAKLLFKLYGEYPDALKKFKKEYVSNLSQDRDVDNVPYTEIVEFKNKFYSDIHPLTFTVYNYSYRGDVDEKKLDNILNKDIETKYKNLETKIKKVCGDIVDASNLSIADNGMINGYIKGCLGNAYVETIVAGGYNQDVIVNTKHGQIAHYRVLVKKVR